MFIVVSYDISDDKRRTKIMKTLRDFGHHVQYSVFECDLKPQVYERMRQRLKRFITDKDDSLRFYFLDEDAVKKIEVIGAPGVRRAREWAIIGKG